MEVTKTNNNYRALYARKIMEREPDLNGIFEPTRTHSQIGSCRMTAYEFQYEAGRKAGFEWGVRTERERIIKLLSEQTLK